MDRLIKEYELLYNVSLKLITSDNDAGEYQYSFNNNSQTYYLVSSRKLTDIEYKSMIIGISIQLNTNTSIEQALVKSLNNSMEYGEQLLIEEYFSSDYYTLFAIRCHEIEDITTLIYQMVDEPLVLVKKDNLLIGLATFGDLELTQRQIVSMIESELMIKVKLYSGHLFTDIRKLNCHYSDLIEMVALADLYYNHKHIIFVRDVALIRLVNSISKEDKQSYTNDLLKSDTLLNINEDDLKTINSFFDNQLSIAETSRELYIHRNTLIYRLDKYKQLLGLDIRHFDDAMKLKIILMISQLKSLNKN